MKFLAWCGCVTVSLGGLELARYTHDGWQWVWFALLTFYFFAGIGLGGLGLAKLVSGKMGAGGLSRVARPTGVSPALHKEE